MAITETLVLPADVVVVPVGDLPEHVRASVECDDGDFAVTRPRARTPSRIVDADAAELLAEFRTPRTVVEAVIRYCRAREADPEQTLVDAYPMLRRLVESQVLVPADSEQAGRIVATFEAGDDAAGYEVLRCVQVLEDTELYQVRAPGGVEAALKMLRAGADPDLRRSFAREAAILRHLDGVATPRLLDASEFEGRPFLAMEWCAGAHATEVAQAIRRRPGPSARADLLGLCRAILDAYARIHERGVIHADVHPGNLLVGPDGSIRLIDFGLARLLGAPHDLGEPQRGGVAFYFEPEYARARRGGHRPPRATEAGEQHALAAMLTVLLTGAHYVEFSIEKAEMHRQIAEDVPVPFGRRGLRPWPEVEAALARALSKDPADRFPTVAGFSARLGEVAEALAADPDGGLVIRVGTGRPAAEELLDAVVRRLGPEGPLLPTGLTKGPLCSVNNGEAGIAYALYRIACLRDDPALLALADVWASKAAGHLADADAFFNDELEITPAIVGAASLYHTGAGVHCVRALIGQAMGDVASQHEALTGFLAASDVPCENIDLTLGRSGTLLACSLLLDALLPDGVAVIDQPLRDFGAAVSRGIWDELDAAPPIRDRPKLDYLGIAHGWAGVIYATLRWSRSSGRPAAAAVAERLQQLAELAEPTGRGVRWPRKVRKPGRSNPHDFVPGWCNGSAGHVHLWALAHRVYGEPAYFDLAERAARHALDDPDTVGDLCCGLGGRAYSLLIMYRSTGDASWLRHARDFAEAAVTTVSATALREDSLYKGHLGIALLAADLSRPESACMPLFDHEGWPDRPAPGPPP